MASWTLEALSGTQSFQCVAGYTVPFAYGLIVGVYGRADASPSTALSARQGQRLAFGAYSTVCSPAFRRSCLA